MFELLVLFDNFVDVFSGVDNTFADEGLRLVLALWFCLQALLKVDYTW